MSEPRKRFFTPRRAVRWLAIAAVCVLTLEIAARFDDWVTFGAPLLGRYEMEQLFQPTPRGLRGVPNAKCMKWGLNGEGFRGPEVQPASGQTRVVTYGASETFGIYEDTGQEYPRALEHTLNARTSGDRFEVINAGIPGMRVGSGVLLLQDLGASLHPQVVVVYSTPTHYIGVSRPYCGRPVTMPPPPGFSLPKLRLADKLKDRVKEALPPKGMTAMRKAGIWWESRHQTVIERVAPESLDAFESDLHCALKTVREIGAVPILVTHANRFGAPRPDDDYWLTGWRGQYPEMKESGLIDLETQANGRIRAVARAENVILVDAAQALGGVPENFADHAHFTNAGAAKLGALLSRAVPEALDERKRLTKN